MSVTFTKLFSSITESTVWCEPASTRLVWITMLAMADKRGRVWASIPGLANRARVPLDDTEQALTTFLGPDRYSRTPDNEGRRIEPIDGGWRLLNYDKYRDMRDSELRAEQNRDAQARHRDKVSKLADSQPQSAQAEAEAEAVKPKNISASAAPRGKRPIPDGWKPKPETLTALSTELKIDATAYVPAFIDSCLAKDYRYKDFEAAFRKCVRDDWPKLRQVNGKPVSTLQPVDKKCACGTSLRFGSTDGLCNPCWRLKTYGAAEARA